MVGIFLICFLLNGVSYAENLFRESNGIGHRATIQPEGKVDQLKRLNYYRYFVVVWKVCVRFLLVIFVILWWLWGSCTWIGRVWWSYMVMNGGSIDCMRFTIFFSPLFFLSTSLAVMRSYAQSITIKYKWKISVVWCVFNTPFICLIVSTFDV